MGAKRVLLVDDDPLVLKLYRDGLTGVGFEVRTASDGIGAMTELRAGLPDVVVLDLMMPRFNGADVLKFIRTQPRLASLPVVVLSNSFMDDSGKDAITSGAQKALFKARCTPAVLQLVINEVLEGPIRASEPSVPLAVEMKQPAKADPPPPAVPAEPEPHPEVLLTTEPLDATEFRVKVRADFLENASSTCGALRQLFMVLTRAHTEAERKMRLHDLCRKVHFITSIAGLAGCARIAQMASVTEAMLFDLIARPALVSSSVVRTLGLAIDFLEKLFTREGGSEAPTAVHTAARILLVDDDAVSNRLLVSALQRGQLQADAAREPRVALQWLSERQYEVVLLDIEMPGMDGFEVCRRLRALPGYDKIPVIFVTNYHDFDNRAKSVLSGGNDLIAKPVMPMELAVKVVMHLLDRGQPPA
jgi:CheY-like chemotaxis protein